MQYINSKEKPVIAIGHPGISDTPASVCRSLKRAFDPENAERAAVLLLAELAMLKLDEQIFRRNMPANQRNGLCLVLTGEAVSPLGFRYREFHFRLAGRNEDPAILHRQFSAVRTGLPLEMFVQVRSGKIQDPVRFVNWKIKKMDFGESSCNGAVVTTGTMELTVHVCFAP